MASTTDKLILLLAITFRVFIFNGSVKANGVILEDIARKLDTATSVVAWAMALQNGVAYMIAPLTLLIMDTVGHRELCVVGGVLSGFGYIFCGFFMDHVWQVFFAFVISGFGFGISALTCYIVLKRYFDNESLPKVISVVFLFDYLGVAVLPLLLQYFIEHYGVANAMILFGAFVWNVVLSGVAIKNQPREHNNIPKVEEDKTTRNTRTLLFFKEKYSNVVTLFHHKNLIVLLVMEIVGYYMFTSWA
ncbi:monocarboxylate transporter 14-like [Apostichopus japonicus]|uniref:monocarboxylate transporter 14-like n=1 Tax=Stichopus japonicus TaxID=307972 RepID=UPI003AB61A99